MQNTRFVTKNLLLSEFPDDVMGRLSPHLELVDLTVGKTLYRANEPIREMYFLEGSMASIVATTADGQSSEIGVIGREGVVGHDVLLGTDTTPHDCLIQIPDHAYRIDAAILKEEFDRCEIAHDCLLLFIHNLMTQISQTTLCHRLHSLEDRLPRWLLMCLDRVDSDDIAVTQEFLAMMLGVSRVSVTAAASALQNHGLIKYSRGRIRIIDRLGLEKAACECYELVRLEYGEKSQAGCD